jgi:hypothetical protein
MLFHGMDAAALFFQAEDIAPRLNCFSIARVGRASHMTKQRMGNFVYGGHQQGFDRVFLFYR